MDHGVCCKTHIFSNLLVLQEHTRHTVPLDEGIHILLLSGGYFSGQR